MMMQNNLRTFIRSVPDFPKQGIVFRDITTLLKDKTAFHQAATALFEPYRSQKIDKVASVESRGFILGAVLAYLLNAGFVLIRKPGKLPAASIRQEYELEYGTDAVEIHTDAITPGERVLVHDDLLATGGTVLAVCKLIERLGGEVAGLSFLIELDFLKGRQKLQQYNIHSLIHYSSEEEH
ncbi:MAG: adenine phosphoribosyltransferase [Bacteroidota bacterium]